MASLDPLRYAASCINALESYFTKKDDVVKSFRARARELAESAYYNDLAYLFAYIASKSAEYCLVGELLKKDIHSIVEEIKNDRDRVKNPQEKSYGLYGAFLSKYIQESGIFDETPKELGQLLLQLRDKSHSITPLVLELTKWLKRIAEAKFEAE